MGDATGAANHIYSSFKSGNLKAIVNFLLSKSDEFIVETGKALSYQHGVTLWEVVDKMLVLRDAGPIEYMEVDPVVLECLLARLPKEQGYKKAG